MPATLQDFVSILRWRADHQGEALAFRFLKGGVDEDCAMTYAELDTHVCHLAGRLHGLGLAGERVLLLYPATPPYLVAMFACLYAGAVPVLLPPPRPNRSGERLKAVARDAQPRAILTSATVGSGGRSALDEVAAAVGAKLVITDTADGSAADRDSPPRWRPSSSKPDRIAYLQYTSGSTSAPKGVMITHGNMVHNCRSIAEAAGAGTDHTVVSWLPFFHDMGLIGGVFIPLYLGCPLVFMPPEAFVMKPVRWLRAISRYRATLSPAPNFAYDMCVRRFTAGECEGLDLSHWRVAFNGSERIDPGSLRRFATTFGAYGFRPETFYPCYGLAESTLFVTGGDVGAPPVVERFCRSLLLAGKAQFADDGVELVGCGKIAAGHQLRITDPESGRPCPPGQVGEIWVTGPSVAAGYWQNPESTAEAFHAREAATHEGPFLRTGDLGFTHDGELFVTGRLKDLIIMGGRNIYPEDIETVVELAHPSMYPQGAVAFAIDDGPVERLVVVAEVEGFRASETAAAAGRRASPLEHRNEIVRVVSGAVTTQHDVSLHELVLVKRRTLPKTPSGKKMRAACRQAYIEGRLHEEFL